jgi:hypothetical protein
MKRNHLRNDHFQFRRFLYGKILHAHVIVSFSCNRGLRRSIRRQRLHICKSGHASTKTSNVPAASVVVESTGVSTTLKPELVLLVTLAVVEPALRYRPPGRASLFVIAGDLQPKATQRRS